MNNIITTFAIGTATTASSLLWLVDEFSGDMPEAEAEAELLRAISCFGFYNGSLVWEVFCGHIKAFLSKSLRPPPIS
ncbi:MAG: hypothetical protein OXH00_15145 [Candidatus Poribacteria bacterium]|nr:hypothetical protein [Candidatus Poribacteria bacterium]